MNNFDPWPHVIVLFAVTVVCAVYGIRYVRTTKRVLNLYTLALFNYMMVQPISGLSHLLDWGQSRGFYDLVARGGDDYVGVSTLATVLGLVAMLIGFERAPRPFEDRVSRNPWQSPYDPLILGTIIIIMVPLCLYSIQQIYAIRDALATSRIIALKDGNARFAFMSQWFVWVVTFAAGLILIRLQIKSKMVTLFIVGCATVCIVSAVFWSGGRSIILVMVLPLLIYAEPRLVGVRAPVFIFGSLGMVVMSAVISNARAVGMVNYTGFDMGNWLDWEWGRFSIIGCSLDYINMFGYLMGETFIGGFLWAISPLTSMIGLPINVNNFTFSYNVTSRILFGNYDFIHVVPGLTAELYMNFGQIGVFAGYAVLGRCIAYAHNKIRTTHGFVDQIMWNYIGILLVFRTIPADSASIWSYFLMGGTPLYVTSGLSHLMNWVTGSGKTGRIQPAVRARGPRYKAIGEAR